MRRFGRLLTRTVPRRTALACIPAFGFIIAVSYFLTVVAGIDVGTASLITFLMGCLMGWPIGLWSMEAPSYQEKWFR